MRIALDDNTHWGKEEEKKRKEREIERNCHHCYMLHPASTWIWRAETCKSAITITRGWLAACNPVCQGHALVVSKADECME